MATSRLADQDPPLVPMDVELSAFAEEIAEGLRQRAIDREVVVEAPDRIEVTTDRTLLYRILYNLGDNAMKYSDRDVRIRVRRDGEGVRIEVRDRGIGIAPEDIPRVFERFEQLDSSKTRRVGGVGLGLYLSTRAAQALGGVIDVESQVGADRPRAAPWTNTTVSRAHAKVSTWPATRGRYCETIRISRITTSTKPILNAVRPTQPKRLSHHSASGLASHTTRSECRRSHHVSARSLRLKSINRNTLERAMIRSIKSLRANCEASETPGGLGRSAA